MMERRNGVFNWSRTFSSPLEMNKLALVNFSHSQAKLGEAGKLTLYQTTSEGVRRHEIVAKPQAKLLGVLLDSKLSWTAQQEKVRGTATKFTAAFRRYTKAASGIRPMEALRLYNAVAVPRICYAADIWYKPPNKQDLGARRKGSVRLTRQLESIQRQAAIAITGAMGTTAGDIAIVHANIKPIAIQLGETILKSYARYTTRPTNHPLYPAIRKTAKRMVQRHKTALHLHAEASTIGNLEMETITATRAQPGSTSPHRFREAANKEESIKWDSENFSNGTMLYTDGSGYRDMVGASAVLYENGHEIDSLKFQLGTAGNHTVFEGELVGILLGIHLASKHPGTRASVNFSIDNQATIRAIQNNARQPAQYLIDEIHRTADALQGHLEDERQQDQPYRLGNETEAESHELISFTWVAGHMDSVGNERADVLAKEAAEFGSSNQNDLPVFLHRQLPISISATKQAINAGIKKQMKEWWQRSPRFRKTRLIDPSFPSAKYIEITSSLNRRQASILTQLRTGHAPINQHLHRIGKSDTPYCPQSTCIRATEDIRHLIFTCPRYAQERYHLTQKISKKNLSAPKLFADGNIIPHTLNYLNRIGRFRHIYGDIASV